MRWIMIIEEEHHPTGHGITASAGFEGVGDASEQLLELADLMTESVREAVEEMTERGALKDLRIEREVH